jgi:hypothetical protein
MEGSVEDWEAELRIMNCESWVKIEYGNFTNTIGLLLAYRQKLGPNHL